MIENNNPEIDVDDLMGRIQREASRWQSGDPAVDYSAPYAPAHDEGSIEKFLNDAAAKSEVRTRWSGRMDFVLFRLPIVRRTLLGGLAFLFRDQRHVNLSLLAALREYVVKNRELTDRVARLEYETMRLASMLARQDSSA